jgi:hypothetical protein
LNEEGKMSDETPQSGGILNIGEFAKPATVLVERISDFVGGAFQPYQMKRVASAEADVAKIKAQSRIDVTEIEERGLHRLIREEGWKQGNMESIVRLALPGVKEDAKPEDIPFDWLFNFFEKCRLVSDEEMQKLWANILASEANEPNSFSKRTVDAVASFDKKDAELFTNLCSFVVNEQDGSKTEPVLFIYNEDEKIYRDRNITYIILSHLEDIGLIRFNPPVLLGTTSFTRKGFEGPIIFMYGDINVAMTFPKPEEGHLGIGRVILTNIGRELAPISGSTWIDGFFDYLLENWVKYHHIVYSPYPRPRAKD